LAASDGATDKVKDRYGGNLNKRLTLSLEPLLNLDR